MNSLDPNLVEYLANGAANKSGILTPAKRLYSPHGLYAYPARFSPHFAGRAIEAVSKPGDTVLDPFMGSGTTLIEAIRLGRKSFGVDVSPISNFIADRMFRGTAVAELKRAQDLSTRLIDYLREKGPERIPLREDVLNSVNLNHPDTVEIGSAIDFWLQEADAEGREVGRLLRAFVLSAGQWALDGRRSVPQFSEFMDKLAHVKDIYPMSILAFGQACQERWGTKSWHHNVQRKLGDAASVLNDLPSEHPKFDSLITSPPYPGVHILYGKWQIEGRRETKAPQWIVGSKDLKADSKFTMGTRRTDQAGYFGAMGDLFSTIKPHLTQSALSVHMVGFRDPEVQLPEYIKMMNSAGFEEIRSSGPSTIDGRIWRRVPSRKFYAEASSASNNTSNEVVLLFSVAA